LKDNGAIVHEALASRVDLNVDIAIPKEVWLDDPRRYAVCRSGDRNPFFRWDDMTGIQFGQKQIKARLYDKPREIKKSKKIWMYDIWGISYVPEHLMVIRVEFEMLRETLKELGMETIWNVLDKKQHMWAYCTRDWLRFEDRPGLHHTQRSVLPWWEAVQRGFGDQKVEPLIRQKSCVINIQRLGQQMYGLYTSLVAATGVDCGLAEIEDLKLEDHLRTFVEVTRENGVTNQKFTEDVRRKLAKFTVVELKRLQERHYKAS
jgi:hypothetical protein